MSECAIYVINKTDEYEYHPSGVPSLGAAPEYLNQLVIAPYASAMALMVLPVQATKNLQKLASLGAVGQYGLYEALDFT